MQEGRHESGSSVASPLNLHEIIRGSIQGLGFNVSGPAAGMSTDQRLDNSQTRLSAIDAIDKYLASMAVEPEFDPIYNALVLFENAIRGNDSILIGRDARLWLSWFEKQRAQDKVDEKLTIIITCLDWIQQVQQAEVNGVIIDTTKLSLQERTTWNLLPKKYIDVLFSLSSFFNLKSIGTQICHNRIERWCKDETPKPRVQLENLREISVSFVDFFDPFISLFAGYIDQFLLGSISNSVRRWFEETAASLVITKEILTDLLSTIIEASLTPNQQMVFDTILHSVFALSLDNVKKSDLTEAQRNSALALIGLIFCSFNACLSLSHQGRMNHYADYFNYFFESVHTLLATTSFNVGGGLDVEFSGKAYRGLKLRSKIIFLADLFSIFIQSPQNRGLAEVTLLSFNNDSNLTIIQLLLSVIEFVKDPKSNIGESLELDRLEPLMYHYLWQLVSERDGALLPDLVCLLCYNDFEWGKFFQAVEPKSNDVSSGSWDASLISRFVHCQFNPNETGSEDYRQSLLTHLLSLSRFDVVNLLLELSLPDQLFFPNHIFLQDAPWTVEFKALENNVLDSCKAILGREVPLPTVIKCFETLAGKVNKWNKYQLDQKQKNQGLELFGRSSTNTASDDGGQSKTMTANVCMDSHAPNGDSPGSTAIDPFINLCKNLVRALIHVTPTSSFHLMKPLMLALLSVIPDEKSAEKRYKTIINDCARHEEEDLDLLVQEIHDVGGSLSKKKKSQAKRQGKKNTKPKSPAQKNKRQNNRDATRADRTYTGQGPSPKVFPQGGDDENGQELKVVRDEGRFQIENPDDVLAHLARIDPDMKLQQSLGCPLFLLAYQYANTCEAQREKPKSYARKFKVHLVRVTLSSDLEQQVINHFMESPNSEGLRNCLDMVTKMHPSFSTFLFQTLFDLNYLSETFTSLKQLMDGSLAKTQFIDICYDLISDTPDKEWLKLACLKRHVITHATHQLQGWMDCYTYLDKESFTKLSCVVMTMLTPFKDMIPQLALSLEDETLLENFLDITYLNRLTCFDQLLYNDALPAIMAAIDKKPRVKNDSLSMASSVLFTAKSTSLAEPGLTEKCLNI